MEIKHSEKSRHLADKNLEYSTSAPYRSGWSWIRLPTPAPLADAHARGHRARGKRADHR